jgi:hypothetical protein
LLSDGPYSGQPRALRSLSTAPSPKQPSQPPRPRRGNHRNSASPSSPALKLPTILSACGITCFPRHLSRAPDFPSLDNSTFRLPIFSWCILFSSVSATLPPAPPSYWGPELRSRTLVPTRNRSLRPQTIRPPGVTNPSTPIAASPGRPLLHHVVETHKEYVLIILQHPLFCSCPSLRVFSLSTLMRGSGLSQLTTSQNSRKPISVP